MCTLKQALTGVFAALLLAASGTVSAMTARDLLQEKDSKVVYNYLSGLADMMSYMEYVNGNDERGRCIYDWYYDTEGSIEMIYGYLEKYPDKFAESILIVLAKRSCPLPEQRQ